MYLIQQRVYTTHLSQSCVIQKRIIWDKVFKNGPTKICGRQPLKKLKWYGRVTNLKWYDMVTKTNRWLFFFAPLNKTSKILNFSSKRSSNIFWGLAKGSSPNLASNASQISANCCLFPLKLSKKQFSDDFRENINRKSA